MTEPNREAFVYLLNAMENAAAQDRPSDHDYFGKRQAVLKYVADLEARLSTSEDEIRKDERAKIMADPGNQLFGKPLAVVQRLIHQQEQRLSTEVIPPKFPSDADRYAYNLFEMYKRKTPPTEMEWATILSASNVLRDAAQAYKAQAELGTKGLTPESIPENKNE